MSNFKNIEKKEKNGLNFLRELFEPFVVVCSLNFSNKKERFERFSEYMYVEIEEDESGYFATFKTCSWKEKTSHVFKGDVNETKKFLCPRFNQCIQNVIEIFLLCQKNKFFPKIVQDMLIMVRKKIHELIMKKEEEFLFGINKLKIKCIKFVNEKTKIFADKNDIHYFIDPKENKTFGLDFNDVFENIIHNVLYGDFYVPENVVLTNCQGFNQIVKKPTTEQFEKNLETIKEIYPEKTSSPIPISTKTLKHEINIHDLPIILIKYILEFNNIMDKDKINFLSTCKKYNELKKGVIFKKQVNLSKIVTLPYYNQFTNVTATGAAIRNVKKKRRKETDKTDLSLLPAKLKKLELSNLDKISLQSLTRGLDLTHLVVKKPCKRISFNKSAFSEKLQFLTWECGFMLTQDLLPDSLEALKINNYIYSDIYFPKNLKQLDIGNNFYANWEVPPQLRRLIINRDFVINKMFFNN